MGIILGIGELLWDIFPTGKFLGGAPANFAHHCRQLDLDARPVSRVGEDHFGHELITDLKNKGIPTNLIQIDPVHPTGTVQVKMNGTAHDFVITENVAWDYIALEVDALETAADADAICFGSLAQRSPDSRIAIQEMIRACPGLIVYDINLRQNFYSPQIVEDSLGLSNVLKLNLDELAVLKEMLDLQEREPVGLCRELIRAYSLEMVCVTRAADGALIVGVDELVDYPGEKVDVVDTVGCGDAYTAVLVYGLLNNKELVTIARDAAKVGTFVAAQPGATPIWPEELKKQILI